MYDILNTPVNYGGLELKNRVIFAPTTLGLPQEEQLERLRAIARGGCAMIIIGDVPVGKHGFGPSLYSKKEFAWYARLTSAIHQEGCLVCAQLHQSDSNVKAMLKYVPGVLTKRISMQELRPLLNQEVGPYITRMSAQKAAAIAESFGEAAVPRKTGRALRWRRRAPSAAVCRTCPSTVSWRSARRSPTMATPAWWKLSCLFLFRCWSRQASPASM